MDYITKESVIKKMRCALNNSEHPKLFAWGEWRVDNKCRCPLMWAMGFKLEEEAHYFENNYGHRWSVEDSAEIYDRIIISERGHRPSFKPYGTIKGDKGLKYMIKALLAGRLQGDSKQKTMWNRKSKDYIGQYWSQVT